MGIFPVIMIAVGLAMDACAVSISSGMMAADAAPRHAVKMGLFCGIFQFAMPLIGWLLGSTVREYIEAVDHFIAFGLLAVIGGRMIASSLKKEKEEIGASRSAAELMSNKRLFALALATSIDALAVGVSFAVLRVDILLASAVIGAVAFLLSFLGCLLGKGLGAVVKDRAELLGGIILVLIGLGIFLEHVL